MTDAGGPPERPTPAPEPTAPAESTSPSSAEAPPPRAASPLRPPPPPAFGPPPPPAFLRVGGSGPEGPATPVPQPPPTAEVLAIPLGPRRLVGMSLDLLTRPDAGLRSASFYIGLILLVTVAPAVALFGSAVASGAADALAGAGPGTPLPAWAWWLLLALAPASLGFIAGGVEARALATAIIGGRAEGRPLRLRESIAVSRARFWPVLAAEVLVGALSLAVEFVLNGLLGAAIGGTDVLGYGVSVLVGIVVGMPFIYATPGIVLGEAGAVEALRRSVRLARTRVRLAFAVTLFSVLSGLVVQFGLGLAVDTVSRVVSGAGLADHFPPALAVLLAAALVFAYGTLVLLAEAIAAAPAVHAFVALTHYTGGLELGRRRPLIGRRAWEPWFTPGLAAVAALALASLVIGVLAMPLG